MCIDSFTESGAVGEPSPFEGPSSPKILEVSVAPDITTPIPRPDKNYVVLENPWSDDISYF